MNPYPPYPYRHPYQPPYAKHAYQLMAFATPETFADSDIAYEVEQMQRSFVTAEPTK
jgi:hypothetical protein